jgi:hypothetical protein
MSSDFTPVQKRLFSTHVDIIKEKSTIQNAIFQHSVLCQTFMPYRNPGKEVRIWSQTQGNVSLAIQGSEIMNPKTREYEFSGLPYGPKARLILAHINSEAIRSQSPDINVEETMSAFMKKMGLHVNGYNIKQVKNQLRRIAASTISLAYTEGDSGVQVDLKIVKMFNLWFPKDERHHVLWNSNIKLTTDYFESLINHAVPLDERALAALAHTAMGLDIYVWLVQRLHRIEPDKPVFLTWAAVKDQFGRGYNDMYKFKQVFRKTLRDVLMQYPKARIKEQKNKGFYLANSPSPLEKKKIYHIGG